MKTKSIITRMFAVVLCALFLCSSAVAATMGERNALLSAHSYLSFTVFSYTGLIDQLEFEGYTTSEATYAADNC